MAYRRLWILIEGNDEKRFFETVKPIFENTYDFVQTWPYAQEPTKKITNFLKSIKAMNSHYLFLCDINDSSCVTAKKQHIKREYKKIIKADRIIILIKEIESWYLAGLGDKYLKELGIKVFRKTDNITKEQFNNLMPRKFDSRVDFMSEILKRFSVETAKKKNKSFNYFMSKLQVT